ncbi:hypothetical protein [Paenibacillus odorifer]|uniref:hypothetical protein n=1 Tax=Paenibacillus odorifer TaxID=189426 RepID=UPI00096DD62A|nr:hypothetical protein [Paenibacillus odorifer]OME22399.1 hypothetical protein BSK57_18080 [Paenibacillus odorifer]
MKKQRSLPAIAAIAALTFGLTACGGNNSAQTSGEPTATPSPTPTESASTAEPTEAPSTPVPTENPSTATPTENPSTAKPSSTPKAEGKTIKMTAVYIGQIDSHSVEIATKEGPTAFEISAGMESILDTLNSDDSVVIEYVEKAVEGDPSVKQRVLTKLALAK